MLAGVDAVAAAPPPAFSGGGFWEAMHAPMTGYHEVRVQGQTPGGSRLSYRMFCYLDREGPRLPREAIALLDGGAKPLRTALAPAEYEGVRWIGVAYRSSNPWRIAVRYRPGEPVPASSRYLCDALAGACPHRVRLTTADLFPALPAGCPGVLWRPEYQPVRTTG